MFKIKKILNEKGITDYVLWLLVLLILMVLFFAILYYVGIQQIQDFLRQNLIK